MMKISKEVTLGQLFQASVFVIGFVGFVYTLRAELENMKSTVAQNGVEHTSFVRQPEFLQMQQDVREIRNMVFEYVSKANGPSSGGGAAGASPNGRSVTRKPSGANYPDTADVRGTERPVFTGPDYSWAESNQRPRR